MKNKVKIGLIQMAVPPVRAAALVKAEKMIKQAARRGAKIICLPELFNAPYFPQKPRVNVGDYCEPIPGETTRAMTRLAKELKVVLIVPFCEKTTPTSSPPYKGGEREGVKYHNTATVFDERGNLLGKYRKIHIPHDPGFYEKDYFDEGDKGYLVFSTKYGKIAVLICYDQWFPEAARSVRLMGAQIIFYPTALGWIAGYDPEGDWHDAWETVQRGHAIANSVYVATVNRVGSEGRMRFWGQSFVSDPFGKLLKRASAGSEEVLVQELDLGRNEFFSEGWGFLRNRRPDTYKALTTNKLVEKYRGLKTVAHYQDEIKALESK